MFSPGVRACEKQLLSCQLMGKLSVYSSGSIGLLLPHPFTETGVGPPSGTSPLQSSHSDMEPGFEEGLSSSLLGDRFLGGLSSRSVLLDGFRKAFWLQGPRTFPSLPSLSFLFSPSERGAQRAGKSSSPCKWDSGLEGESRWEVHLPAAVRLSTAWKGLTPHPSNREGIYIFFLPFPFLLLLLFPSLPPSLWALYLQSLF